MRTLGASLASICLLACGGDRVGTDPGGGSGTLLVEADIDVDRDGAEFRVTVDRLGQDVNDAVVTISS